MAHNVPSDFVALCNLGVFGNNYIRNVQPETTVKIIAGEKRTLQIEHISAEYSQAIDLAINLRQKSISFLSFVTINNSTGFTEVTIDTTSLSPGEHTLILESFDESS